MNKKRFILGIITVTSFILLGQYIFIWHEKKALGATATSSLTGGSGQVALPNTAPYNNDLNFRVQFRIHNIQSVSDYNATIIGTREYTIRLYPGSTSFTITSWADGSQLCEATFPSGESAVGKDMIVMAERDGAHNQLVIKMINAATGGDYVQSVCAINNPATSINEASGPIGIGTEAGSVDYVRGYTTAVDASAPFGTTADGDMFDYELEGNLNDSSSHGLNLTPTSPVFGPTPSYAPVANISGWTTDKPVARAGVPFTLSGVNSFSTNDGGITSYQWKQTAGPNGAVISNPNGMVTVVTAPAGTFGQDTFQLTVTDSAGSNATTQIIGVVDPNSNGVITPPGQLGTILGPVLINGASPWPWFDNALPAAIDYITPSWTTVPAEAMQAGTVSMNVPQNSVYQGVIGTNTTLGNSAVEVVGTGTNFTQSMVGQYLMVNWDSEGVGQPTGVSSFYISSVVDATHLFISNYWIAEPAAAMVNLSWGLPVNYSLHGWHDYNYNTSLDYYEAGLAAYRLYYATGLTAYQNTARSFCQNWWKYSLDSGYNTPRSLNSGYQFMMACAADNFALTGGGTSGGWWDRIASMLQNTANATIGALSPTTVTTFPVGDTREPSYVTRFTALMAQVYPSHTANPAATQATWCNALSNQLQNFWMGYTTEPNGDIYWQENLLLGNASYPTPSVPPGVPGAAFGTSPWRTSGLSTLALIYSDQALTAPGGCGSVGNYTALANKLFDPSTAAGMIPSAANFVWDYARGPNKGIFYDILYPANPEVTQAPAAGTTLSVTNGSKTITGTGTSFTTLFAPCNGTTYISLTSPVAGNTAAYQVMSCQSDTQLTINTPYPQASDNTITAYLEAPAAGTNCGPYSIASYCDGPDRDLAADIGASSAWLYAQTGDVAWKNKVDFYDGSIFGGCPGGPGTICSASDLANLAGPDADGGTGNLAAILPGCNVSNPPCGDSEFPGQLGKTIGMTAGAGDVPVSLAEIAGQLPAPPPPTPPSTPPPSPLPPVTPSSSPVVPSPTPAPIPSPVPTSTSPSAPISGTMPPATPITSPSPTSGNQALITGVTISNITQTSARVTVSTVHPAAVQVKYGATISYGATTQASPYLPTVYVNLGSLSPGTTYNLEAAATLPGSVTAAFSQNYTFTTLTSAAAPSSPTSYFTRNLKLGDVGPDVALLQTVLKNLGFFNTTTTITQIFGAATQHAMILFQAAHLLSRSGYLDTQAFSLMNKIISANPALTNGLPGGKVTTVTSTITTAPTVVPQITKNLYLGSSGPQVVLLQQFLTKNGDFTNAASGYYGGLTQHAVEIFQLKYSVVSSSRSPGYGSVGPLTRAKINSL
jgi:peptidoglycan hydrolase-like protein with peptidoglycan-binding domain